MVNRNNRRQSSTANSESKTTPEVTSTATEETATHTETTAIQTVTADTPTTETPTVDTALAVAETAALAVKPSSSELALKGINGVKNLKYEIVDGFFFLSATASEDDQEVGINPQDEISFPEFAKLLDLPMSKETIEKSEDQVLTHSDWASVFRGSDDEISESIKEANPMRYVGMINSVVIAINTLDKRFIPMDSANNVVKFFQQSKQEATKSDESRLRFCA